MTNLKLLTSASLVHLGHAAALDPSTFAAKSNPLDGVSDVAEFDSPVQFRFVELIPGDDVSNDRANAMTMYQALPGLTPAFAADERLWTSLCLKEYWEYTKSRFPIENVTLARSRKTIETRSESQRLLEAQQNWLREHYFASTARIRLRGNSIGRLWWMAHYAHSFPDHSADDVLELLIGQNQDTMRSLVFDRPWIASSPNLASAVIDVLMNDKDFNKRDTESRRYGFRRFLKRIDLLAGRRVLSYLPKEDLLPELQALYDIEMPAI